MVVVVIQELQVLLVIAVLLDQVDPLAILGHRAVVVIQGPLDQVVLQVILEHQVVVVHLALPELQDPVELPVQLFVHIHG